MGEDILPARGSGNHALSHLSPRGSGSRPPGGVGSFPREELLDSRLSSPEFFFMQQAGLSGIEIQTLQSLGAPGAALCGAGEKWKPCSIAFD